MTGYGIAPEWDELEISTIDGDAMVWGWVFTRLAVHRGQLRDKDKLVLSSGWVVTHIQSGNAVVQFSSLSVALNFAEHLEAEFDLTPLDQLSWGVHVDTPPSPEYTRMGKAIARRCKHKTLSVSVKYSTRAVTVYKDSPPR